MNAPAALRSRGLGVAYAVSGACALVYQVVWTHAFTEQFGASGTTFLVVLCAFIGGLGLGAVSSRRFYTALERRIGGHGLRNYGRTELAIAVISLALYTLTTLPFGKLLGPTVYRVSAIDTLMLQLPTPLYFGGKLVLAILAVGGPCFLMGLTFPYLCSLFPEEPQLPSRLYAANTLGASAAVLVTEFWGFAAVGYLGCFAIALAGTVALGLWFVQKPDFPPAPAPAGETTPSESRISVYPAVLSGFLCGGLQALAYVFVKLVLGPTRGTFALLAFFSILGIWLASTLVHRVAPMRAFLVSASWLALGWCVALWFREPDLSGSLVRWGVSDWAPASPYLSALIVSVLATGLVIFIPYMLWSLLLPSLCDRQQARGENLSWTYGLNTLAFLAGVLVFGWALQYMNFFYAARVFALAAFVGLVILTLEPAEGVPRRGRYAAAVAAVALGAALLPRSLEMRLIGGRQAEGFRGGPWRSTPQHLFWIRHNGDRSLSLMFDGHSMSGTSPRGQIYMRSMAHLPLLLHSDPKEALLICFGVGVTADAIRTHRTIARVDIVDLARSVYLLNGPFAPFNGNVLGDGRLRLICDDGRQFLKFTQARYDFVTLEPPPPLQPGISRLYSAEFYEAVRRRLNPGGIVSQWLPESQMDERGVNLIAATFVRAFPDTLLFVGFGRDLILVGRDRPFTYGALSDRLEREPEVRAVLSGFGLGTAPRLLATILRTEGSMRRMWGGGPAIHDGFASLDALQIGSPVQRLHPKSTWVRPKPELVYDLDDVLATLRAKAPAEAPEVARLLADPRAMARTVPPGYFAAGGASAGSDKAVSVP